jgi:hypothetical protein
MSEVSHSPEYTRFLKSLDGADPSFRETLDLEALRALGKDERKAAEEVLIERVKEEDDWRVPPALAALRTKRAVRPMKARLGEAKGKMKIALARALMALGALDRLDETVIQILEEEDPDDGIVALAAADDLNSEPLVKALARASLHHPGPEVRVNAGAALLSMAKLDDDPLVWKFRPLYLQLGEEDEKVRREAFAEICRLTQLPPAIADQA